MNSVTALLCPHMTQKALLAIMDVINPLEDESEEMEEDEESDDEFAPIPEEVRFYVKTILVQLESLKRLF